MLPVMSTNMTDTTGAAAASATTTDPPPPPSVTPLPTRVIRDVGKKGRTKKWVTLGGIGPFVYVVMSKSFLGSQTKISHEYVFDLYVQYFLKSFGSFFGVEKRLETNNEVFHSIYLPAFHKYYKHTDGGWAGRLVPDKLKQLYCHLSWVLAKDVGEWGVQKISNTVERHFRLSLLKLLKQQNLFHPTWYVTAHMKGNPLRLETVKFHL